MQGEKRGSNREYNSSDHKPAIEYFLRDYFVLPKLLSSLLILLFLSLAVWKHFFQIFR